MDLSTMDACGYGHKTIFEAGDVRMDINTMDACGHGIMLRKQEWRVSWIFY